MISPASRERYARQRESSGCASVTLVLEDYVLGLTRGEAEAIRHMVKGAFNLEADKVEISDNHAHRYEWPGPDDLLEKGATQRNFIRRDVEAHYSRVFEADEFSVVVMVSLSMRRHRSERKATDRENTYVQPLNTDIHRGPRSGFGGVMGASGPTVNVQESMEGVLCESWEKTFTVIPSGELMGVGVLVQFDLAAVERVLGRGAPTTNIEVEAWVDEQEKALSQFLEVCGKVSAGVVVSSFARRRPAEEIPPEAVEVAQPGALAALATESPFWTGLAVTGSLVVITFIFSVFSRLRARSRARHPRLGTLPELSDDAVPPLRAFDGSTPFPGRFGFSSASPPGGTDPLAQARHPRAAFAGSTLQDGLLGTVDDTGFSVRERPEIAGSVLRLWLAQDEMDSQEGGAQG